MEYKDIKQLMDDMGNSKLDSLDIEFPDGIKISMKKNGAGVDSYIKDLSNTSAQNNEEKFIPIQIEEPELEGNIVKSPMVGTFYASSSPDKDAFVKVGSRVKKGDTLCIIEAMKLMNQIESEFEGEIVEILVKNEEVVDYNKPLFIIA